MTNRLQPGTTPHDTEKCQILISRPVALIAAAAGQSVSRNYRRPPFREIDRFENVRKPRSRRHRRYFAFKFGAWSARTPSGSSSGSWKATSLRPIR
jgi:hypothetical protein